MVKVNYIAMWKVYIFSGRGSTKNQACIEKAAGSIA